MRPDSPEERPAPVNARLQVIPPDPVPLAIKATIVLSSGASVESVKTAFLKVLAEYLPIALEEGEVKYTRISAALSGTEGVSDFSGLLIGVKSEDEEEETEYGTSNLPLDDYELPTVAANDLDLTTSGS